MIDEHRIRWRCRRGMLELDLVLSRFLDARLDQLTAQQRESLLRLLRLPDVDLWDMVSGRREAPDPGCAEIVALLR
ncbi:MAG TPA: succinate dehydrogenase assembly factor 2 [Burkholderiales bacterium]|jgi:antitoxin CptB|nr:succinate dehydrogenase assembly factor 2 [Burkholderiales bacterium]